MRNNLTDKLDRLNNRILVKNSHKYVLKKLNTSDRDDWCQRYMSVAASKLSNPRFTQKLPFSLTKKLKTTSYASLLENSKNIKLANSTIHPKCNIRVLAIDDTEDNSIFPQFRRHQTIDSDEQLIKTSKQSYQLLQRAKRKRPSIKLRTINSNELATMEMGMKGKKEQFELEPWGTIDDECEMKENKF